VCFLYCNCEAIAININPSQQGTGFARPDIRMTLSPTVLSDLSCSERLTVWTVRRLARRRVGMGAEAASPAEGLFMPCFRRDFEDVASAFAIAIERLAGLLDSHLDIAIPRAQALTRTEICILEATTAAQAGEEAAVRRILRTVFPHHHVLAPFAAAVTQLGACLAGAGHWLPRRRVPVMVADQPERAHAAIAASLTALLHWHERDLGRAQVLWPHTPDHMGQPLPH